MLASPTPLSETERAEVERGDRLDEWRIFWFVAGLRKRSRLLRSGTFIGTNVGETTGAFSKKDFLYNTTIAHKEGRGSHYWLKPIHASENFQGIHKALTTEQAIELQKIIVSICRFTRKKLNDDAKENQTFKN